MNSAPSLAPIHQSTLADTVTERLREAIIRGELQPGERLAEPALADQMNVSRSPIREALRRLTEEGLLTRQPKRSCYVWAPSKVDVDEIFSLRTMIEILAAEWAIPQMEEDDFAWLERLIEQQRRTIAEEDILRMLREDKEFHEYICRRANHARLLNWWHQIIGQWEVLIYRRMQYYSQRVVRSVLPDHQAILTALRQRDLDAVTRLHRTINQTVCREIKETLHPWGIEGNVQTMK